MLCPSCGTELPEGAVFCYRCSARLREPPQRRASSHLWLLVIVGGAVALLLAVGASILVSTLAPLPPAAPASLATVSAVSATATPLGPTPVTASLSGVAPAPTPTLTATPSPSPVPSAEDMIQAAMRCVVRLETDEGAGTAFKLRQRDSEAIFLTNAHVVEGSSSIKLVTLDGISRSASVLAQDANLDLAVVVARGLTSLPSLSLGDSDVLRVGDPLYVIGFPLGSSLEGPPTVTRGIVSGRRTIDGVSYIQTDAAMNPGNSGGPVVNQKGEVVGIATRGYVGPDHEIQGINFAIPSSLTKATSERLMAPPAPAGGDSKEDVWIALPLESSPSARAGHTAVWTGREMIVWGGMNRLGFLKSGARYDPARTTWIPMSTAGAPSSRILHTSVWTGSHLLVWGGFSFEDGEGLFADGGKYDPASNRWTALPKSPLAARMATEAVWTGSEMIVWGGLGGSVLKPDHRGDGARFNPTTGAWAMLPSAGAPSPRSGHSSVWTGTELIVWGGARGAMGRPQHLSDGARYNPKTSIWTPITSAGAPRARSAHRAVWTGREMIVWGGESPAGVLADGARYDPQTDTWRPLQSAGAPGARSGHTAVWTGTEMIVWGGSRSSGAALGDGARYDPARDKWTLLPSFGRPSNRYGHGAVWDGTQMIVWGGYRRQGAEMAPSADGARYVPPVSSGAGQ